MRLVSFFFLALFFLAPACSEDESDALAPFVAPGSRGSGEECMEPEDCQEGLLCLDGHCTKPLASGMKHKEEQEQMHDERYKQLDDKVRSIEEQMLK